MANCKCFIKVNNGGSDELIKANDGSDKLMVVDRPRQNTFCHVATSFVYSPANQPASDYAWFWGYEPNATGATFDVLDDGDWENWNGIAKHRPAGFASCVTTAPITPSYPPVDPADTQIPSADRVTPAECADVLEKAFGDLMTDSEIHEGKWLKGLDRGTDGNSWSEGADGQEFDVGATTYPDQGSDLWVDSLMPMGRLDGSTDFYVESWFEVDSVTDGGSGNHLAAGVGLIQQNNPLNKSIYLGYGEKSGVAGWYIIDAWDYNHMSATYYLGASAPSVVKLRIYREFGSYYLQYNTGSGWTTQQSGSDSDDAASNSRITIAGRTDRDGSSAIVFRHTYFRCAVGDIPT